MSEQIGPGRPKAEIKKVKASGPSLDPDVYKMLKQDAKERHLSIASMEALIIEIYYGKSDK